MASLRDRLDQIYEDLNIYSSDTKVDDRLLTRLINSSRVKWFKNTYNKGNRPVPDIYKQSLSCVEVIQVDQSECCEITTDCTILRTKDKLPEFMTLHYRGELIYKVSGIGVVNVPFKLIPYSQAEWFGNQKYTNKWVGVFPKNQYLYFLTPSIFDTLIEKISVYAVFTDPTEAYLFTSCEGKPCWTPEDTYPLEDELWEWMYPEILQKIIGKLTFPTDNSNNNKDALTDPTNESK